MDHPIKRPTFDEHISELFDPNIDARCMMARGVELQSYQGVMRDASKISDWIGSGRMPPPDSGRSWSAENLQTFRNWSTLDGNDTFPANKSCTTESCGLGWRTGCPTKCL